MHKMVLWACLWAWLLALGALGGRDEDISEL
jgi:hypothetical protein